MKKQEKRGKMGIFQLQAKEVRVQMEGEKQGVPVLDCEFYLS